MVRRSGIICGPIWGSFPVRGSFAGLYRCKIVPDPVPYDLSWLKIPEGDKYFLLSSFGGFNVEHVIMYLADWRCSGILDFAGVLYKVPCSRPDSHTSLDANY